MQKRKFIIITNAPRERKWEHSYNYNLSGRSDVQEKILDNPHYRRGELCLIHPAIIKFYQKHNVPFQEEIAKGVTTTFPSIIDETEERGGLGFSCSPEGIPTLAVNTQIENSLFRYQIRKGLSFNYVLIPLKPEEFTEVDGESLDSVLEAHEQNNASIELQDKATIRQKLAVLKSFDLYVREKAILIRDIPIALTKRV